MTAPPPPLLIRIYRTMKWLLFLCLLGFIGYTLIYVQCDSTRTCPLPFNPQTLIKQTFLKTETIIDNFKVNEKVYRLLTISQKIVGDTITTGKEYYDLVVKVEYDRYIKPFWETPRGKVIKEEFNRYLVERLKIYQVWGWIVEIYELVRDEVLKDSRILVEVVVVTWKREWPIFKKFFIKNLDKYAVLVVDKYLPVALRYLDEWIGVAREYTKIGSKFTRGYVNLALVEIKSLLARIDVNLKSHPAYSLIWVEYDRYAKEYVDIVWAFVKPGLDSITSIVDYGWKVLEGEVLINTETVKEFFSTLYSKINW